MYALPSLSSSTAKPKRSMNRLISPGAIGFCFKSTMWIATRRSLKNRSAARVSGEFFKPKICTLNIPVDHARASALPHFAAQHDARAVHQDRALDQVGMPRHQFQSFGARGRRLLHVALPVELVSGIQEFAVVAGSNQLVEPLHRESPVEIDFLKLDAFFAKRTLRVAAGGSRGFEIESHAYNHFRSA